MLDTVKLGYLDEDEEVAEATDRHYWEEKGTKETAALADEIIGHCDNTPENSAPHPVCESSALQQN